MFIRYLALTVGARFQPPELTLQEFHTAQDLLHWPATLVVAHQRSHILVSIQVGHKSVERQRFQLKRMILPQRN